MPTLWGNDYNHNGSHLQIFADYTVVAYKENTALVDIYLGWRQTGNWGTNTVFQFNDWFKGQTLSGSSEGNHYIWNEPYHAEWAYGVSMRFDPNIYYCGYYSSSGAVVKSSLDANASVVPEAPNAPANCAHTRISDTKNMVTWNNNIGATRPYAGIEVQRSVNGGSWQTIATVSASSTSYEDNGTSADNICKYRVVAFNYSGRAASNDTEPTENTPIAPTKITGVRQSAGTIIFSVDNRSTTSTGAYVEYSLDGEVWTEYSFSTPLTGVVKSFTASMANSAYWRIANVMNGVRSSFTQTEDKVIGATKPFIPKITSYQGVAASHENYVLSWEHSSEDGSAQTKAEIYMTTSEDPSAAGAKIGTVEGAANTFNCGVGVINHTGTRYGVRTYGASDTPSDKSWATLYIYQRPNVNVRLSSNGKDVMNVIKTMPLHYDITAVDDPILEAESFNGGKIEIADEAGNIVFSRQINTEAELRGNIDTRDITFIDGKRYGITAYYNSKSGLVGNSGIINVDIDFDKPVDANLTFTPNPDDGSVSLLVQGGYHETAKLMDGIESVNTQPNVQSVTAEGHSEQGNLLHGIEPTNGKHLTRDTIAYTVPVDYASNLSVQFDRASFCYFRWNDANGNTVGSEKNVYTGTTVYAPSLSSTAATVKSFTIEYEKNSIAALNDVKIVVKREYTGKNLLDVGNTIAAHPNNTSNTLNSLSDGISYIVPCKPNMTYTLSRLTSGQTPRFVVASTSAVPTVGASCTIIMYYEATMKETFTTGADANYLVVFLDRYSAQAKGTGYQLEGGSTATFYEPYNGGSSSAPTPYNPQPIISAGGKNLLDEKPWKDGFFISESGVETASASTKIMRAYLANGQYTITNWNTSSASSRARVHGYKNGSWVAQLAVSTAQAGGSMSTQFTVDSSVDEIRVSDLKDNILQIEQGPATSYVPYGMVEATVATNNLWRYEGIETATKYNVTCTNNGDGSYTLTGTNNSASTIFFYTGKLTDADCLESTSYSLTCEGQTDDVKAYVTYYNAGGSGSQKISDAVYVPASGYNDSYRIGIQVNANATVNATVRPMLVKGTQKPSSFTPYAKSVSYVSLRAPEWLTNDSSRVKSAWDGVVGSAATMTAESLVGEPSAYQWQTTTDGTWANSTTASAKTQNLSISVTQARIDDKRYYRCEMTVNGSSVYTEPVLINYLGGVVYGLQSLPNGVHDTLTAGHDGTVLVKRVGSVDLGSLTWQWQSSWQAWYVDVPDVALWPSANTAAPIMADNYSAVSQADITGTTTVVGIAAAQTNHRLFVRNGSSTDKPSGLALYELAEQQEIELEQTDFQDVPTGTVTYEWGTVGESSMTTYDGKAEAVSVTVNRVTPDGTVCIADRVPLGTGMVDWYAPLNTDYSYQVVSNAESGAVSAVDFPTKVLTNRWFIYYEKPLKYLYSIWNPTEAVSFDLPSTVLKSYARRKDPVLYNGPNVVKTIAMAFEILSESSLHSFEKFMEKHHRGIVKTGDGKVFHALIKCNDNYDFKAPYHEGSVNITATKISGREL